MRCNFFFWLSLFILIGCKDSSLNSSSQKTPLNENIRFYLNKSKNDSLSTNNRLKFIDKALKEITVTNPDSLSLAVISHKSNLHYKINQPDSVLFYDRLLLKSSKKSSNNYYSGKANFNIAMYFDKKGIYDSAYYYLNQSKNNFTKIKDSSQAGRKLLNMAILQQNKNDFFGSKETFTEALKYLNTTTDQKFIASVYNELATTNRKLLNYSDAIQYYKKAIQIIPINKDQLIYKNNLATVYTEKGNYDTAIQVLQEILLDSLVEKGTTRYARILHNLSYAQWKNGADESPDTFLKALGIRKKEKDKRGQISSYTDLAEYFSKPNPFRAKKYLDTVIQISKLLKIPRAETDALQFLMQLEPKNGTFKDRYIFLKDSMYQNELKVKTQFAKMKYDDVQEKQKIVHLEKENINKQIDLIEQRNQKIVFLLLSSLLLISGISLFYVLRQRHKKEKLLEVFATENRISQKIHDELANDVYNIMSSVQHEPKLPKDTLLDKLEGVYNKTRDISHENGSINTKEFHLEIKQLLAQYQSSNTSITIKGLYKTIWGNVPDHKKITIHRVLNELLVNMKKHSKATLVIFNFKRINNTITINYADNGVGMAKNLKKKNGLQIMENRIKGINGSFTFESELGKGVKTILSFPT